MPYDIRKRGNKFCVVKRDGGKTMGCHTSRAKAARQLSAIMANEHGHHKTSVFKFDGVRHMLLVSTNGYKDREGEYVSQYAMRDEINRQWQDDGFHGDNVVKFWHDGPAIGDIIWANQEGPFTVEIARERVSGLPIMQSYTKAIWDYLEHLSPEDEKAYGASIGFAYRSNDKETGADGPVYRAIRKYETSVLPLIHAANPYTFSGVLDMSKARDAELEKIAGKTGWLDSLRRVLSGATDALGEEGKEAKHFDGSTTLTRQDLVDMLAASVQLVTTKAVELAAKADDADAPAIDLNQIAGDVVDTFLTVPTVNLETAADILAVNDADDPDAEAEGEDAHAHADSGEHAAEGVLLEAPGLMDDKALEAVIEVNKTLMSDQAEIVKALQGITPVLGGLDEVVKAVKGFDARLAAIESEFKQRPRASVSRETVSDAATQAIAEQIAAEKQAEDDFYPKAQAGGA